MHDDAFPCFVCAPAALSWPFPACRVLHLSNIHSAKRVSEVSFFVLQADPLSCEELSKAGVIANKGQGVFQFDVVRIASHRKALRMTKEVVAVEYTAVCIIGDGSAPPGVCGATHGKSSLLPGCHLWCLIYRAAFWYLLCSQPIVDANKGR